MFRGKIVELIYSKDVVEIITYDDKRHRFDHARRKKLAVLVGAAAGMLPADSDAAASSESVVNREEAAHVLPGRNQDIGTESKTVSFLGDASEPVLLIPEIFLRRVDS